MSHWFRDAVAFGIGFLEGYAETRGRQQQPSFQDCMAYLGRVTPFPVINIRHKSATFAAAVGGRSYSIVVVMIGDDVSISVVSNITFPSGRAPRDVCEFLIEKNKTLAHADYDLLETDDGDKFFVRAKVRCERLTPAVFEAAVGELAPRISALDQVLLNQGYAS